MSRFCSFFVLAALLLPQATVLAQSNPPEFIPANTPAPATGPLNCFDHYRFGSVTADLTASVPTAVPGSAITFSGRVINSNAYPLLDGTLYVRIFKRDETTFASGDGNEVIDQFVVEEGITLPSNGSLPLSYEWRVPVNAASGEYYAAYFYTTAQRYNLMGLSFTDDVVGNQAAFAIKAETDATPATLSKGDTTINDQDHGFASFPLHFPYGETVTLKTTLSNPTDSPKTMPLQWNQYAWDGMREENRRHTKTELITLDAGEEKTVSYTTQAQAEPIVYVTAVTQDNEAKSILNVRFVRDGVPQTRINFPGLSTFPLKANEATTLFACAHSTNEPIVPGNVLTLTLTDKAGKTIHEYRYEGDISGAMGGFGELFTPTENINYATLTATLERNGMVVEQVTQTYDCAAIDQSTCLPETNAPFAMLDFIKDNLLTIIGIIVVLGLLALIWWYRRHRGPHIDGTGSDPAMVMTKPMALLLLAFALPSLFFLSGGVAEAKTVSTTTPNITNLISYKFENDYCYDRCDESDPDLWLLTPKWIPLGQLLSTQISVTREATLSNSSTGVTLADGDTVTVGDSITFTPAANSSSQLSWNGTGYSSDTPPGYWTTSAPAPCSGAMTFRDPTTGGFPGGAYFSVYIALTVAPVVPTITHSGTATLSCDGSGFICTVTGPGTVNSTITWPSTGGNFHFSSYKHGSVTPPGANYFTPNACHQGTLMKLPGATFQYDTTYPHNEYGSAPAYTATIPQQQISFTVNAAVPVPTNVAPSAPTIAGPTTGLINMPYDFTIAGGVDPDPGDQIKYQVDWNNDGVFNAVDGDYETALMASGGSVIVSRSWSTNGAKNFQARTVDNSGATSGWTGHVITVSDPPPATVDFKINGTDGPVTVTRGDVLNIEWTATDAPSCSKWGGTWGSGEVVPLVGTDTHTMNNLGTTTFMVQCGGATDQVEVVVVNERPNQPTISHPTGVVEYDTNTTMGVVATDNDGDALFYEIDWTMDGEPEENSGAVTPSGVMQNIVHRWTTTGTETFQMRAVDPSGAVSDWGQFSMTVNVPPPPVPVLEMQVNGGTWTTTDQTIDPGDTVNMRWDSTNATNCAATSGAGFDTGGAVSGTDSVTPPAPNTSDTFGANCTGPGGGGGDTIVVTTRQLPNFKEPSITYTPSTAFNPTTGTYAYLDISFLAENNGGSATKSNASYELQFDQGRDGYEETKSGSLGLVAATDSVTRGERMTGGVPFGPARIRVMADNTNAVVEVNEGDNTRILDIMISPPEPGLNLVAARTQLRNGETTTLNWSTTTSYPMNCRVYGPGVDVNPSGLTGSQVTAPVMAKSEYTFTCTEPVTGSTFTDRVVVGTQGEIEEI